MSETKASGTNNPQAKLRRNTPQRKTILAELCATTSHPTAAELYNIVRQKMPRVSLGTVYRNLEVLHQDGLVRRLDFAGAETRFDGDLSEHYHVRCAECGRVEDVHDLSQDHKPGQPDQLSGYRITGHQLEYSGVCPSCQKTPGTVQAAH